MDVVNLNIKHAIKNQLLIELDYEGKGSRQIEPFCLGVTNTGHLGLRAYQVSGLSKTENDSWKLLDLEKATDIKVLSKAFDPKLRTNYQRTNKDMKIIYYKI